MKEFRVDDDLVDVIWRLAEPKPFENLTFSDALRRVLQQGNSPASGSPTAKGIACASAEIDRILDGHPPIKKRTKAPKADIAELVAAGLLREGEELFLVDYSNQRVKAFCAQVAGNSLLFKGERYSMSDLAQELLKRVGYQSNSVRGPAHWVNAKNVSVKAMWEDVSSKGRL